MIALNVSPPALPTNEALAGAMDNPCGSRPIRLVREPASMS